MNNKSIWILSHYSQQPPYNTGLRYHNWGKLLVNMGYNVTIYCASSLHGSNNNLIDDATLYIEKECDRIKYVYINTCSYVGNGLRRILNMIDYYRLLPKVVKKFNKPDIIIARSPHLLTCRAGIKIAHRLGVPCICDIVDLWPSSIVEYGGFSNNNPIIKILYQLEKWIYKKCDAIIFSIQGGSQYIIDQGWNKIIDLTKVFYINMGVDLPLFDDNLKTVKLEDPELLRDDIFKIVYCGSVRQANNIKKICDAALLLKERGYSDIRFMIHGAGTQVEELQEYCASKKIDNLKLYGRIEKAQIPYVLSHGDVCLLSFMDTTLKKYGGSQQKTFEYYASGKPILSNWNGGYNLIKEYNCGYVTKSQTPEDIADGVLYFYNMPLEEREKMGKRARKIAEDYAQPKLVEELFKAIKFATNNQ